MSKGKRAIPLMLECLSVILVIITAVSASDARQAAPPEENGACLTCHSQKGIIKRFDNNESVSAYVDPAKYNASVHNFLKCSQCHAEFSVEHHPTRAFKSLKQYQTRSSHICRRCHSDKQIMAKTVHAGVLSGEEEGRAAVCNNCHDAHAVTRVSKRTFTSEEQYCLRCHSHKIDMHFKNGETTAISVDTSLLGMSVHSKISCSDCHFGFSSEEHPKRNFRTKRDFIIASAESCRRCHFDKYTKTMEGIHYTMLSQGNLKAPVCTDCHGSHAVFHMVKEKIFIARRCQKCHAEIYDIYARSVHGNALFNEHNKDVPVCIDCHTAHNIENPFSMDYREKIPEMCGNCHANKAIAAKYGLSTDVVESYLSDFHGVTLKFYKMQKDKLYRPARPIAVCTDCHGTHNINSTTATDATVLKANLIKRCQKCHEGATEKFPDTWLSHYGSSITRAPLVFIIRTAYKIFIPVMLIGLLLQIVLHIWRYAVNR